MSQPFDRDRAIIADHVNTAIRSGIVDHILVIRNRTTGEITFHDVKREEPIGAAIEEHVGYQQELVAQIAQGEQIEPQLDAIPTWWGNAATIDDRLAVVRV